MFSESGLIFGIINIIGNFGTVFVDQSYWQSAIAARPTATYKGYILGGLCWFAIPVSHTHRGRQASTQHPRRPAGVWFATTRCSRAGLPNGALPLCVQFTMATTLGLAGRALDLPITIEESNQVRAAEPHAPPGEAACWAGRAVLPGSDLK